VIFVVEPYGMKFGEEIIPMGTMTCNECASYYGICTQEEELDLQIKSANNPDKMFYAGMISTDRAEQLAFCYKDGCIAIMYASNVYKMGTESTNVLKMLNGYLKGGFLGTDGRFYYDYVTDEMHLLSQRMAPSSIKLSNDLIRIWTNEKVQIASINDKLELVRLA